MKLTCVRCEVSFKVAKNGATVVEMVDDPPRPYAIWECDIWRCPSCGVEVCAGFGMRPIAEHWQPRFEQLLTAVAIHSYQKGGQRNQT